MSELRWDKRPGQRISAAEWNRLNRAVAAQSASRRVVVDHAKDFNDELLLVELDDDIGPDESSEFRDRQATALYWDHDQYQWKRDEDHQIPLVTEAYGHHVYDAGERIVVWYDKASGKYLPVSQHNMRHVITSVDDNSDYPAKEDNPNVYGIAFLDTSYSPTFGGGLTASLKSSQSRLTPQPPHGGKTGADDRLGHVFNLYDGDDAYIPEGSIIPAWFIFGQWYTYVSMSPQESSQSGESTLSSIIATDECYVYSSGGEVANETLFLVPLKLYINEDGDLECQPQEEDQVDLCCGESSLSQGCQYCGDDASPDQYVIEFNVAISNLTADNCLIPPDLIFTFDRCGFWAQLDDSEWGIVRLHNDEFCFDDVLGTAYCGSLSYQTHESSGSILIYDDCVWAKAHPQTEGVFPNVCFNLRVFQTFDSMLGQFVYNVQLTIQWPDPCNAFTACFSTTFVRFTRTTLAKPNCAAGWFDIANNGEWVLESLPGCGLVPADVIVNIVPV